MNKTLRWILGIVIVLVAILFIKRWNDKKKNSQTKVATEKASRRSIIETVNANGKIYPENEVKITPEFSGQVSELKVREGEYVKKGQLLARIGNRTSIEAPMDGIISSLKIKKGESVAGNTFNVGTEMMTVADMSVLELRVDVGENDIVKVMVGDSANVEVDAYNNRIFAGVVTQISNSTRSSVPGLTTNDATEYQVRIRLNKDSYQDLIDSSDTGIRLPFRPGMNASAAIRTKQLDNIIAVPITAVNARLKGSDMSMEENKNTNAENEIQANTLKSSDLEEIVFVLQPDNTVKKLVVQSGIQDINYIEIKSGLKEGDQVVIAPYTAVSRDLKEGMKVKVVDKSNLFER